MFVKHIACNFTYRIQCTHPENTRILILFSMVPIEKEKLWGTFVFCAVLSVFLTG